MTANMSMITYYIWAPAAMARQILSTVAKNGNSTEHFVHLNADLGCTSNIFQYVDLSSITVKISLSLPQPISLYGLINYPEQSPGEQ